MASKQLEGILGKVTTTTPSKSAASAPAAVNSGPATAEVVRMLAAVEPQAEIPSRKPASKKIEAQKSVQAFVPASIDKALRMKAAEEGTTTRNIILRGLKAIGFDVPEEELRDKRSKALS
jgi:hypothetical protein